MNATAERGQWFLRLPIDIVKDRFIMDNASAADWRVLLAIAKHQGYKTRRTFPIYISKTAEEAHCCRRAALKSIDWWVKVGALLKTKRRRVNVYEIPRHFSVPPGISAHPRHITPRVLKRDDKGRIVPSACTGKVHAHGTIKVHTHGTLNQKSSSEVFFESLPPPSIGGNGRSSETSARPAHVSTEILQQMSKELGKSKTLAYLRALRPNQPVPEFLLGEAEA